MAIKREAAARVREVRFRGGQGRRWRVRMEADKGQEVANIIQSRTAASDMVEARRCLCSTDLDLEGTSPTYLLIDSHPIITTSLRNL